MDGVRRRAAAVVAGLLAAALAGVSPSSAAAGVEFAWPLAEHHRLSSTFGPRLKASEGFRYDFHRGIDIPAPTGTPILAIADGTVRIAGSHPAYSDTVVQVRHRGAPQGVCPDDCTYATYLHLSGITVTPGEAVEAGDVLGFTGESDSGFAHLHFELRRGGLFQMHAVHPLGLMAYRDGGAPVIDAFGVDATDPANPVVNLAVSTSGDEADLVAVEAVVSEFGVGGWLEVSRQTFDFEAMNQTHTPKDDPHCCLDDPTFGGFSMAPGPFNSGSDRYALAVAFESLTGVDPAARMRVDARAVDVRGAASDASWLGVCLISEPVGRALGGCGV